MEERSKYIIWPHYSQTNTLQWAPESVWIWWQKKKYCPCYESNPGHPAHSQALLLTELQWLHANVVTNSFEQGSSWEANNHSASQEISYLLCHLKVPWSQEPTNGPYPEPDASNSQFPPYFPKIYSNIILPSMPGCSEWFLFFRFPNQNILCISHLYQVYYMSCPSYPPQYDHLIISGKAYN